MKVQIEMLTTFYITNKTNIWPHTVRVLRRLNENGYGNLGHNVKTCFKIILLNNTSMSNRVIFDQMSSIDE